jgi:integrase
MKSDEHPMLPLFQKFLTANKRNTRLMAGGRKLTKGTKANYTFLFKLLSEFSSNKGFPLRVKRLANDRRAFVREKRYYSQLYLKFTDYLYVDKNQFDNNVGKCIKELKVFFKWVVIDEGIYIGEFYRKFYVWKEEIPIVVLSTKQLNFLIHNSEFQASLPLRLQKVKDMFVFGCTVALRISDLQALKKSNIERIGNATYLRTMSKKTGTFSKVILPEYAVAIIDRSQNKGAFLFKDIRTATVNRYIKEMMAMTEWTYIYPKIRKKRGVPFTLYKNEKTKTEYRFCDLITSHTMRRTAITTMLNLGMEEGSVRKVSGHAPGSKEFYKYVKYSQEKLDTDMEIMFKKLANRHFESAQMS